MWTSRRMPAIRGVIILASMLVAGGARAGDFDTEHIFAFMIGTDIGQVGEREFQSSSTGRFGRAATRFRTGEQEFELELVPLPNLRIELGSSVSAYDLAGSSGLVDRSGVAWQGASIDIRYRLLDRDRAPFGMTVAFGGDVSRLDAASAQRVNGLGAGLRLAFDREVVPGVIAAVNLLYQPEWIRFHEAARIERGSVVGMSLGVMAQASADILVGGEARYLRRYDGIGFNELVGQALFVGPTAYVQLTKRTRLTASWSMQLWGRSEAGGSALDLVNFERHQLRLVYGVNF
ncbi:MAG: hypothetical protein ABWY10_00050 [Tardiphaga sp.]